MRDIEIHSCPELVDLIHEVGFLPLLDSGIRGFSAEELVDEDNRYVVFDDGGWDWPLWKWKGPIVTEGRCVYGKFFAGKAGSLLTTPESLLGQTSPPDPLSKGRGGTPQESFEWMFEHLRRLLPEATEKQIEKLIK